MSPRLGFVAVSGTRVLDPELRALGMTLPGFAERGRIIGSLPSLGLLTLAGMTPASIPMEYLEVPDVTTLPALPGNFDFVAISALTACIREAYALADRYRREGVKVILGGLHVSAVPDEAARHADAIVIGEGESAWPRLLRDLSAGRLHRRYEARAAPFDLRSAPIPRFELLDPGRYHRLTVQTQRGCPFDCDFCGASLRIAPRFQVKPVDRVIAEIRRIREIWPNAFIEFADDNTFADRRHGRELVRALLPLGLRWFTETDLSVARDSQLLALMRDSGCAQILVGFESPEAKGLDGIERHSNWKLRQRDYYREAIARIQAHGITVNGCFVLGLDGAGAGSFAAVREFVETSGLYDVQISMMTPFPGTPLYERLRREGRLIDETAWERCTLFDVNFRPRSMTPAQLREGFRRLAEDLYGAKATAARRRRFFEHPPKKLLRSVRRRRPPATLHSRGAP